MTVRFFNVLEVNYSHLIEHSDLSSTHSQEMQSCVVSNEGLNGV